MDAPARSRAEAGEPGGSGEPTEPARQPEPTPEPSPETETERETDAATLRERLRFETFVSNLSTQLMGAAGAELGRCIEAALPQIAACFGAERVSIIELGMLPERYRFSYGYQAPGRRPVPADTDIEDTFRYVAERVQRGELFVFSDATALPEEAAPLRAYYAREGIQAGLVVPLAVAGEVFGSLSVSIFHRVRAWSSQELERFRLLGELLAGAMARSRSEGALRKSEAKLRAVLSALPDLLFYLSREGVHLDYFAPSRDRLFVPPEEFIGKSVREVLPAAVAEAYLGNIRSALSSGQLQRFEYRLDFGERRPRCYEARLVPFDADSVLAIVQDVTARRLLEERLHQAARMEVVGRLAGGLVHDFNNQLSAIFALSMEVQEAAEDPALVRAHSDELTRVVDRAAALTRQVLAFSRREPLERAPVNLHELLQEVVSVLRRTVDRRVEIELSLQGPALVILGIGSRLQSALLNLGINARDAMPGGGTLRFRCQRVSFEGPRPFGLFGELPAGDYAQVAVRDTGHGIAREHLARLFEPFFTTKPVGEGTGLGLATVYETVRDHGGAVDVASTLGEGSVFTLYLPLPSRLGGEGD